MGIFRRKAPNHLIPVHRDNANKKDWVILLEAGTIVGPSPERLRVARATLERRIVKKYNVLMQAAHFLVVEGYDPRIHAVYFCPQLFRYDPDKKLVPLQGEEIGRLIAQALEGGRDDGPRTSRRGNGRRSRCSTLRCRPNTTPSSSKCPTRAARPRAPRNLDRPALLHELVELHHRLCPFEPAGMANDLLVRIAGRIGCDVRLGFPFRIGDELVRVPAAQQLLR